LFLLALSMLLAGCQTYAEMRPLPDGRFEFQTFAADFEKRPDDPEAEAARRQAIARKLELNGFCQRGHEVLERRQYVHGRGVLGNAYDLYYTVACKE
jgi:hypothetical protein